MVAFAQQMQQVGAVLDTAAPAMVHSARVAFQRAISALVPTAAPVVTDLGIDAAVQTLPMPEVSELSYVFDPKGPGMRSLCRDSKRMYGIRSKLPMAFQRSAKTRMLDAKT